MSRTEQSIANRPRIFRNAVVASATALALASAGCTESPSSPTAGTNTRSTSETKAPTPSSSTATTVDKVTGYLNYDGLTVDNKCYGNGPRPCFAPIRKHPTFGRLNLDISQEYLNPGTFNTNGQYASITWPFETYPQQKGAHVDEFTIVCRVFGDTVYGEKKDGTNKVVADLARASRVWDVVEIPADKSRTGQIEYGYMPERWVYPKAELTHLKGRCDATTNPVNAQVVPAE